MLHARPRTALRQRLLPVLLLGAGTAALVGLATVSPAAGDREPAVLTVATDSAGAAQRTIPTSAAMERELAAARASRSRRQADAEAAAAAAARAQAEAEAAARAQAEAAAAAEKAAAEKAAAEKAAAEAARSSACPVPNATFSDTYGAARSGGRSHLGTDLLAPYGSPVYAVVAGRIRTASSALGGISLYLDGVNGETYFYAHNSANVASTGQRVKAGQLIAKVGSTGNAGGTNHVHFERQVNGRSVNPYTFLRRLC